MKLVTSMIWVAAMAAMLVAAETASARSTVSVTATNNTQQNVNDLHLSFTPLTNVAVNKGPWPNSAVQQTGQGTNIDFGGASVLPLQKTTQGASFDQVTYTMWPGWWTKDGAGVGQALAGFSVDYYYDHISNMDMIGFDNIMTAQANLVVDGLVLAPSDVFYDEYALPASNPAFGSPYGTSVITPGSTAWFGMPRTGGQPNYPIAQATFFYEGQSATALEARVQTPEPATLALLGLGAAGLVARRRSKK